MNYVKDQLNKLKINLIAFSINAIILKFSTICSCTFHWNIWNIKEFIALNSSNLVLIVSLSYNDSVLYYFINNYHTTILLINKFTKNTMINKYEK